MVATAAASSFSPSDARAKLQADKKAEQRRRERSTFSKMPGKSNIQNAMAAMSLMSTAPDLPNYQGASFPTEDVAAASGGENYRRTYQANKWKHQIGSNVDSVLSRYQEPETRDDLYNVELDASEMEANFFLNNQLGLDNRLTSAKRAERAFLQNKSVQEGIKAATDQVTGAIKKELGSLGVNLAGDTVESLDTGEDFGISQGLVFVQRQAQAVRTILSPAPTESNAQPETLAQVRKQVENEILDLFIARFNLHTMSGLSGLLGVLFQWFVLGLVFIILLTIFFIIAGVYFGIGNPFMSFIYAMKTLAGL